MSPIRTSTERGRGARRGSVAALAALTMLSTAALVTTALPAAAAEDPPPSYDLHTDQNPIQGDGSYYSADPAPLVVRAGAPGNDTDSDQLYIYTGHDEASPTRNDFTMNEWGAFRTSDVESGDWTHFPSLMRPEEVFDWATPGRAYAGQVVPGPDGRYYWYVPVNEEGSTAADAFGIGVAVSDSPTGPWNDHAGAPIISQSKPTANTIHNIDPTILIEGEGEDQRVYIYWGSFSNLRMVELDQDMKTPIGQVRNVTGLTGFFEAAWAFERNGTYYMAYAGNNAGPTSQCTPANYHACIAYGTASSPAGPWTYRGTMLAPVSSTTSHPGILEFNDEWYIAYHTADAVGGNHFRRSVAIDKVEWDDTQTPARMKMVQTTPVRGEDRTPRANVAQEATVTVSNTPVPTQYWVKALNDELVRPNPLPPDMWGTWTGNNPPQQWVQYTWDQPMRIDGSQIEFWNDAQQGSGVGVAAPASWEIQYWDAEAGAWVDVENPSAYGTATNGYQSTTFDAVTTTQVRAVFNASTNGSTYSAVAVEEWKILATQPETIGSPALTVEIGENELPGTTDVTYPGGDVLQVPVFWDAVDPSEVAQAGTFTVEGSVLGYAAGRVTGNVTVIDPSDTEGDETAPEIALSAIGSAGTNGWFRSAVKVRVSGTDDSGGRLTIDTSVDEGEWVSTPSVRFVDATVSGDGEHTLTARATDNAGNVSAEQDLAVKIDATVPTTSGVLDAEARSVSVTAADAGSGVDHIEYALGTADWAEYTGPVAAPDTNKYDVSFRAVDKAGNTSTVKKLTIGADISGPISGNVGPIGTPTASFTAGHNAIGALNDGADPGNPSQAQLWGTWSGNRPSSLWVQYDWARPIRLTSTELKFWRDSNPGTGDGVAAPNSWTLQYWDDATEEWKDVTNPSAFGTSTTAFNTVTFDPVTTSRLRATIQANGDADSFSAVAITEWRVFADDPGTSPEEPTVEVDVTASPRCLGDNVYLAVRAVNEHGSPVAITLQTPFGTKAFAQVADGASAYQSFNTRTSDLAAGTTTVLATATIDGQEVTTPYEVAFPAASCG